MYVLTQDGKEIGRGSSIPVAMLDAEIVLKWTRPHMYTRFITEKGPVRPWEILVVATSPEETRQIAVGNVLVEWQTLLQQLAFRLDRGETAIEEAQESLRELKATAARWLLPDMSVEKRRKIAREILQGETFTTDVRNDELVIVPKKD